MPYLHRAIAEHKCETPREDCRRGDLWKCPLCWRIFRCAGWSYYTAALQWPDWRFSPRRTIWHLLTAKK